jgi:hypothetical protein
MLGSEAVSPSLDIKYLDSNDSQPVHVIPGLRGSGARCCLLAALFFRAYLREACLLLSIPFSVLMTHFTGKTPKSDCFKLPA